jgi:hypothetical protein
LSYALAPDRTNHHHSTAAGMRRICSLPDPSREGGDCVDATLTRGSASFEARSNSFETAQDRLFAVVVQWLSDVFRALAC